MADIDILAAIRLAKRDRISNQQSNCAFRDGSHSKEVISLENWDETLDVPGATVKPRYKNPVDKNT